MRVKAIDDRQIVVVILVILGDRVGPDDARVFRMLACSSLMARRAPARAVNIDLDGRAGGRTLQETVRPDVACGIARHRRAQAISNERLDSGDVMDRVTVAAGEKTSCAGELTRQVTTVAVTAGDDVCRINPVDGRRRLAGPRLDHTVDRAAAGTIVT